MRDTSFTVQNCALRINPTQNGGHTRPHVTTAPAHPKMEHHLSLHACSILRWVTRGSVLARAFANCPTKDFASVDHLLPTSSATTTKRALAPGPMRAVCCTLFVKSLFFFDFDQDFKNSNERWRSIHGSEDQNTATKYLKNSSVEGWRSVRGPETRPLHQNTTLRKDVTSIAHATRDKYGEHSERGTVQKMIARRDQERLSRHKSCELWILRIVVGVVHLLSCRNTTVHQITEELVGGKCVCCQFILPNMAEEVVAALVVKNGSGMRKASSTGDDAPHVFWE